MRILDIARMRDTLKDREVAILANGPSLERHWLGYYLNEHTDHPRDTFGVNQSWRICGPHPDSDPRRGQPTWHVALDTKQYDFSPEFYADAHKRGVLFTGSDWPIGHRLGTLPPSVGWSRDPLMGGVCVSQNGTGSVTYVALQLAAWMGYGRIWICGLDMDGPKFTGEPAGNVAAQDSLFRLTPAHVRERVRVLKPTKCTAFQTVEAS